MFRKAFLKSQSAFSTLFPHLCTNFFFEISILSPLGYNFFLPLCSVTLHSQYHFHFPSCHFFPSSIFVLYFLFSFLPNDGQLRPTSKKAKKRNVKQMQTLWDILHLGRQWKINQASACKNVRAHMRMCVYVFVYRSHSTTKERAPRFCVSKVRAKNRGMVWTCREKRSEADKRRRKHVWTVNKTKTGEDGQKLCQRTVSPPMCWAVSNNRFTVHSLDIYNVLLHYMQNNSLTPRGHLTSNPWKPAVSATSALTCAVTQHWFDFTFFVIVTLNLSLPRERSSRRLTHAQLIPER